MTALMAGRLAASFPAANANTLIYQCPAGRRASFTVSFCNQGTAVANVRLALSTSATPQSADWVEYGASVATNGGVLERTGLALNAGQCLVAYTNKATVSVVVYGIEEDIT